MHSSPNLERPRALAWLLAGCALAAVACKSADPAQAVAERFLDLHYIEMDLRRALEQTSGLAQAKVNEELQLLAGQAAVESAARPSVSYRFLEASPDQQPDRHGFVYEVTFRIDGHALARRVLLTARALDGVWRVSNFQESD